MGSRRALVMGGSIAGLFTALLLRRSGWDVDVFERVDSDLSSRGAGIVTHAELFDVLATAGVDAQAARVGVSVEGRRVLDRSGAIVGECPLPQVLTSWGHLYGLLREALPAERYHPGMNLLRVEDGQDAVTATFSDGSRRMGDLLVGTDGLFSTVRAQFDPTARPAYVGYVAWRGLVPEAELSDATRAAIGDHFSFCLPPGEQMLGYPVAGEHESLERGRRRFNFVWYRPAEAGAPLEALLRDVDGVQHQLSIPPHKIRPEVVSALRADAGRLLAPAFAEVVHKTETPFIQAILDFEAPRLVLGRRVVILGDAAFVARPHVGMGVTKAAGDAAALAEALRRSPDDLHAALRHFENSRSRFGAAVIRRARELGAYMQAQILTSEERQAAERHRLPEAVMAETAVASGIAA